MQGSIKTGAAVPILMSRTATIITKKGTTECIAMHSEQWSASVSTECANATWTTASSKSKTKHTAIATRKGLGFGRRSRRESARIPVNKISSWR